MQPIEIKGDWNITKNRLKQKWAALTDDDLVCATGQYESMIERIQTRIGETRGTIERFFKDSARRQ